MKILPSTFLFTFTFLLTEALWGANLTAPISFPSAQVLPKGIRNIQYNGILAGANDKYSDEGASVNVGYKLNRELTWRDLLSTEEDTYKKSEVVGGLRYLNQGLDTIAGRASGVVNVALDVHVPVLAVGVTRKLTTAIAVPIVNYHTHVDTGSVAYSNLNSVADFYTRDGEGDTVTEAETKFLNAVNEKLAQYNYRPIKNKKATVLADIKLVNKYQLSKKRDYAIALLNTIVLPTGQTKDVNTLIDISPGDGQPDVGFGAIVDYYASPSWTLSWSVNYTAQLSDHQALRIPERPDTKLTPDIDFYTDRDLGDKMSMFLAAQYNPLETLSLGLGIGLAYKERDKYTGNRFSQQRYDWLAIETEQNMQSAQVGLTFSTIPLYRAKRFPVPFKVSLNHTRIPSGKNVVQDPITTLQFHGYF